VPTLSAGVYVVLVAVSGVVLRASADESSPKEERGVAAAGDVAATAVGGDAGERQMTLARWGCTS
jgi:hypothetical protein